jgi:cytochrome c553
MKSLAPLCTLLMLAAAAQAADLEAGRSRVAAVCAACHGADGVSVTDAIPNLAAQRAGYIEAQLKAFKDGSRKNPIMSAIAAQLSVADMANVAAYYAAQPGAAAAARSAQLPNVAKTNVSFPEGYRENFVKYHTINFPATRQVRYYFADKAAVAAAKAGSTLPDGTTLLVEVHAARLDADGKPVTGADGFFVADKLMFYTAMARAAGWGRDIPEMLRNSDWNYAAFSTDKQHRPINQAECLACHKPLDKTSYTFTLKQLAEVK